MRAADQQFGDASHRVAHIGEEFVFGTHSAAMLARVVRMSLDPVRLNVFGVELQDLRALVIDPGDGVECCHVDLSSRR